MSLKWPEKPLPTLSPGKHYSLFTIAYKFFPGSFLIKIIAFLSSTSPIVFNLLHKHYGIDSIIIRGILTADIVAGVPTVVLYLIMLARAPAIRKSVEIEAAPQQPQQDASTDALDAEEG
jgi:hypothetical protein